MLVSALALTLATGLTVTSTAQASPAPGAPAPAADPVPLVQARPADSLVDAFGVQTHLGYPGRYQDTAQVKDALTGLGVRHVRDDMYSNRPDMLAAVQEIASAGIRFNLIMGNPETWDTPERQIAAIRATGIAGDVVESLEGANEWNLKGGAGWARELREHQARLYGAAKAEPATRDLPVLAPALGQKTGYLALGDIGDIADLGNAHNYPGGQKPSAFIDLVRQGAEHNVPGKPVIFTEGGYTTGTNPLSGHPPVPEDVAGLYAPKLLLEHYIRGTKRFYNYELIDQRPDKEDHEANFGLLRNDYSRKPSYVALQKLISLTSDRGPSFDAGKLGYEVTQAPSDFRQVLLQKRDGTFVLVMWRDVTVFDRVLGQRLDIPDLQVKLRFDTTRPVTLTKLDEAESQRFTVSGGSVPIGGEAAVLEIGAPVSGPPLPPTETPTATPTEAPTEAPGAEVSPAPAEQVTGPITEIVAAITAPAPTPAPPAVRPYAPTSVSAAAKRNRPRSVTIRWTAPRFSGRTPITRYQVRELRTGRTVTVGPRARTVTLRVSAEVRRATYAVRARNLIGHSPWRAGRAVRLR